MYYTHMVYIYIPIPGTYVTCTYTDNLYCSLIYCSNFLMVWNRVLYIKQIHFAFNPLKIRLKWWCILDRFLPFYPSNSLKNKNFEKWKKHLEISSFCICVPKIVIRWCTLPEIWCMTDVIVISHFGLFSALLPP